MWVPNTAGPSLAARGGGGGGGQGRAQHQLSTSTTATSCSSFFPLRLDWLLLAGR